MNCRNSYERTDDDSSRDVRGPLDGRLAQRLVVEANAQVSRDVGSGVLPSVVSASNSVCRGRSEMAGVLTAVILSWVIGGCSLWKIWRGYDSTLYFTTAMATIAGCAFYILVQ